SRQVDDLDPLAGRPRPRPPARSRGGGAQGEDRGAVRARRGTPPEVGARLPRASRAAPPRGLYLPPDGPPRADLAPAPPQGSAGRRGGDAARDPCRPDLPRPGGGPAGVEADPPADQAAGRRRGLR